ncbi:sensor histidine kinase [Conexibacter woesei]|uniref:histidine kinase n=1 Tax=Conexibacter woesei (strain DSM 14684 / CCUG 47730 / CIP 108061 / JCM 11494 / NBRC 100937 / ID131577) TaxID=469383 RepID=D3F884_CONWI|nr:HAMP domain-containing sensor histidine kinase [Conexibacter woesei]ADB48954.1 integral membrane sensor signal transduction histidine kinase [Conexibacter woesei DSM 14684]
MVAEAAPQVRRRRQMSARLRLTLSYAAFLVLAGAGSLIGIYVVLRYVPNYAGVTGTPREIAGAIGSQREILKAVVRASAVIIGALAVVGLGGGWLLAGWILRPLRDINDAARIAATGRLDHRIRLAGRADEFGQLADSFDHMLDRLHDAFMTQERFAANASHELRTPLTVTATMLDVAQSDPEQRYDPELLERLQITNARAIGLTEALLRLADANAVTAVSEPVDLAAIARAALKDQHDEADRRQVVLRAELNAAPTVGDATLLTQLVTNLLQNATRHNHPAGEARITTHTDTAASSVVMQVQNTGPVYTTATAARLVEPFLRGAGRTAGVDGERGYGLGLALVAQIAAVHDGTLTIVPRDGGGLVVTAAFPCRFEAG